MYNLLNPHLCLRVYYKHTSTQAHKHSIALQKILVRIPCFFFTLLFGLTLLLSSCQKENFITSEAEKFTKQRKKIDVNQLFDYIRMYNQISFTGELQSAVPFNLGIDLKNYHFNSDSTVIFFQISDTSFFRNEYCGGNISFHYDDSLKFHGQLMGWMFDSTNTYLSNKFPLNLTTENGYLFAFDENETLIRIVKSYNNIQTGYYVNIPISELRDSINGVQNFFNSDDPEIECYDWDGNWWGKLWDRFADWVENIVQSIIPNNWGGSGGTGLEIFFYGYGLFGGSNNGDNAGSGNTGGGGSGGGGTVPKKIWDEFCESLMNANNGTYGSQNGSSTVDESGTSGGGNNNEQSDFDKKMTIYKDLLLSGKSCFEIYNFYLQTLNLNSTELAEIIGLGITLEGWSFFKDWEDLLNQLESITIQNGAREPAISSQTPFCKELIEHVNKCSKGNFTVLKGLSVNLFDKFKNETINLTFGNFLFSTKNLCIGGATESCIEFALNSAMSKIEFMLANRIPFEYGDIKLEFLAYTSLNFRDCMNGQCSIHHGSAYPETKLIGNLDELYINCGTEAKVNVFNSTNFSKCK